jgi:hypothetical protein
MLTNIFLLLAFGAITVFVMPRALRFYRNAQQRPLAEYSTADMNLAFRFAPEERAAIVNRGTMSRAEFIQLQKLNVRRIDEELKRRGLA